MRIDPASGEWAPGSVADLPELLGPGDLVVLNDAGTLPASLAAHTDSGAPVEIRLAGWNGGESWRAVLMGAGTWRDNIDGRPAPKRLSPGSMLLPEGLTTEVVAVWPGSPRLVRLRFFLRDAELWSALYLQGRPIQYRYRGSDLPLHAAQTPFGGRPWAAKAPSGGRTQRPRPPHPMGSQRRT